MNNKLKSNEIGNLFKAIKLLENEEEYYNFFEDLCTVAELQSLAGRLEVARLLSMGKTYVEVAQITGASTATISRISKCLLYGADGYNTVIKRIDMNEKGTK